MIRFIRGASALTIAALLNVGCASVFVLSPVEGPTSKLNPLPMMTGYISGVGSEAGSLEVSAWDGEAFEGKWTSGNLTTLETGPGPLWKSYASAYGDKNEVGSAVKVIPGHATLVGDHGTAMEFEFYAIPDTKVAIGFAKDKKGNVFRLYF